MNVAALLHDSPSDDHRRRQAQDLQQQQQQQQHTQQQGQHQPQHQQQQQQQPPPGAGTGWHRHPPTWSQSSPNPYPPHPPGPAPYSTIDARPARSGTPSTAPPRVRPAPPGSTGPGPYPYHPPGPPSGPPPPPTTSTSSSSTQPPPPGHHPTSFNHRLPPPPSTPQSAHASPAMGSLRPLDTQIPSGGAGVMPGGVWGTNPANAIDRDRSERDRPQLMDWQDRDRDRRKDSDQLQVANSSSASSRRARSDTTTSSSNHNLNSNSGPNPDMEKKHIDDGIRERESRDRERERDIRERELQYHHHQHHQHSRPPPTPSHALRDRDRQPYPRDRELDLVRQREKERERERERDRDWGDRERERDMDTIRAVASSRQNPPNQSRTQTPTLAHQGRAPLMSGPGPVPAVASNPALGAHGPGLPSKSPVPHPSAPRMTGSSPVHHPPPGHQDFRGPSGTIGRRRGHSASDRDREHHREREREWNEREREREQREREWNERESGREKERLDRERDRMHHPGYGSLDRERERERARQIVGPVPDRERARRRSGDLERDVPRDRDRERERDRDRERDRGRDRDRDHRVSHPPVPGHHPHSHLQHSHSSFHPQQHPHSHPPASHGGHTSSHSSHPHSFPPQGHIHGPPQQPLPPPSGSGQLSGPPPSHKAFGAPPPPPQQQQSAYPPPMPPPPQVQGQPPPPQLHSSHQQQGLGLPPQGSSAYPPPHPHPHPNVHPSSQHPPPPPLHQQHTSHHHHHQQQHPHPRDPHQPHPPPHQLHPQQHLPPSSASAQPQPQPPPQRQFQNQFHTQFVPGLAEGVRSSGPGSRVGSRVGSRAGTPVGGRERRERDKENANKERERERETPSARVKGGSGLAPAAVGASRTKDLEREREQQIHQPHRERDQQLREQHHRERQSREEDQSHGGTPSAVRGWWMSGPAPPGGAPPPVPTAPGVPPGPGEAYPPPGPYDRIEGGGPGLDPGTAYPVGMEYNGYPGEVYFEGAARGEAMIGVAPTEWGVWEEDEDWEDYDEEGEKKRARVCVHLGTFVYPRLPFPYFFDIDVGGHGREKVVGGDGEGDGDGEKGQQDREETEEQKAQEKGQGETNGKVAADDKMDVDVDAALDPTHADVTLTECNGPNGVVETEKMAEDDDDDDEEKVKEKKRREKEKTEAPSSSPQEKGKVPTQPDKNEPSSTSQPKTIAEYKVDTETRVTIVIPNGHIPLEKPRRPRIWGGGIIRRMRMPRQVLMPDGPHQNTSALQEGTKEASGVVDGEKEQAPQAQQRKEKRRRPRYRRVYTDDSDVFLCALHSGWVTWSGAVQARREGKEMKIDVRVLRCIGAEGVGVGMFYGKEEVVGRFLGGWGEKCFVSGGGLGEGADMNRRGEEDVNMQEPERELDDEENDGRGLVSAGWGTGHDGSAIEVLDAQFVEAGSACSLRGLRNRKQRLLEYHERRASVVGPAWSLDGVAMSRLAGRKRRRAWDWPSYYPRRLLNASTLDAIPEQTEEEYHPAPPPRHPDMVKEESQMNIHTVVFGISPGGDIHAGYKYVPDVLKNILFPAVEQGLQPPRKRRRIDDGTADNSMDVDSPYSGRPGTCPVILDTAKESYLLSPKLGNIVRRYDIALVLDDDLEEEAAVETNSCMQDIAPDKTVLVAESTAEGEIFSSLASLPVVEPPSESVLNDPTDDKQNTDLSLQTSPRNTSPSQPETSKVIAKALDGEPVPTISSMVQTDCLSRAAEALDSYSKGLVPTALSSSHRKRISISSIVVDVDDKPKQLQLQTLQQNLGEDMFRFADEGVSVTDNLTDGMKTEWVVHVKRWRWAPQ